MRQVGMLDLASEFAVYGERVRSAIEGVLENQQFIGGAPVTDFEAAVATRVGVSNAIAVSNGTDALLCTLMALGIGPGDEVIVPTFTFFATGGSVYRLGAKPVFVDVDDKTFNIDPRAIESAITDQTRVIIPVHVFGQCADMDAVNKIARKHGLTVIEDAAQAIGATYQDREAGALGDAACLSFYPTKNLGGVGEGGMILTNDDKLGEIARQLRNQGQSDQYLHERVGGNFRLDALRAAALSVKLRHLDDFTAGRRRHAAKYDERLGDEPLSVPHVPDGHKPVYHQYTILCDRRDELRAFLEERGVGTGVYYPIPLHLQPCFASLGYRAGACPVAERLCERVVSLPCHPMLRGDDVEYVVSCVREFFAGDQPVGTSARAERAE